MDEHKLLGETENEITDLGSESDTDVVTRGPQLLIDSTKRKGDVTQHWTEKDRKLWTVVLFTGTALAYSCRTAMSITAYHVAQEFQWDKAQQGLVLGSFFWGYPALQIPGGGLSDRVGGDRVIATSALIWSTMTALNPFVPYVFNSTKEGALTAMILSRFLQGLAQKT